MAYSQNRNSRAFVVLLFAALVFLALSYLPYGNYLQWPFVIITTFIHEMGHGLTAVIVGGDLIQVEIYKNASGLALTRTAQGWPQAAVAAGGLLAPSLAGALFIICGTSRLGSSWLFTCFSIFILISCLLWVRSTFGLLVLLPTGLIFLALARRKKIGFQQFLIQFMGVHMIVDTFSRTMRYLFTGAVQVGNQSRHSDTAAIAEQLGGSHILWAVCIAILAISILGLSLRSSYLK